MSLISVVMGCYNCAELLPATLESILTQRGVDLEFIVVNDGSNDDTGCILLEYAGRDRRLLVFDQEHQGLTRALILGCSRAKGTCIARQDVGDISLPGRLQAQSNMLASYPECAFVSSGVEFCGPQWELMWQVAAEPIQEQPESIISPPPEQDFLAEIPHHGSVMFRRSCYERAGGYRKQFYYGQDWDLWYRLAELGTFYAVPEVLYQARIFPRGISMMSQSLQQECAKCSLEAFRARLKGETDSEWLKQAHVYRPSSRPQKNTKDNKESCEPGWYFIGEALRRAGNDSCRRYFLGAIQEKPLSLRSYIRLVQSFFNR